MSEFEIMSFDASTFTGRVRLFPLPNLVLFPHVLQPLHIFEPRYRQMLEEAVAADRLIAMALLAPGWEPLYDERPPLHPVACLGRVATYHRLADGRYNLLLQGLKRVALVRELPPTKLFREAEVQVCEDNYPLEATAQRPALQRDLLQAFRHALPRLPEGMDQLEHLLRADVSLGMLTDLAAYTLELPLDIKQRLLAEPNVDCRAQTLLAELRSLPAASGESSAGRAKFPPDFSCN
ncbi:MAG: LON peptidase substrate-binding domain-containing protein [Pirellulales bacterium]|nr:LON peptidase substrate-binding domain-containing protein [Pirellulales bacterium]